MHKGRLEAFSDGVIAIILTIMVLELRPPHGGDLAALRPLIPTVLGYILSFIFIGIYWTNHHHLLMATQRVTGSVLWANLHLLFWLSLTPFVTAWMGENSFSGWPVALYGLNLLMCGVAYSILTKVLLLNHERDSALVRAIGSDLKGNLSILMYLVAVALAFVHTGISLSLYVAVAVMWLVPDRRIEKVLPSK